MKTILINKDNLLYRFFEFLYKTDMYDFIEIDYMTDSLNTFTDACTFIQHCSKVVLYSLFYLLILILILGGFALIGVLFFGSIFMGIDMTLDGKMTALATCVVVFPAFAWFVVNKFHNNTVSMNYNEPKEDGVVAKFVEIVSARSNKFCVKIDVVESQVKEADPEVAEDKKD